MFHGLDLRQAAGPLKRIVGRPMAGHDGVVWRQRDCANPEIAKGFGLRMTKSRFVVGKRAAGDAPRQAQRQWFGAVGVLRLLLVAVILIPAVLGVIAAFLSYRANYNRAAEAASQAVAVAGENTAKVLDTHLLVAARIGDLISGMTDEQIRAAEKSLHDRIAEQVANLPQVAAAWVIGSDGRELVSARIYPVNGATDLSARQDFRVLRDTAQPAYIWMLSARSLDTGEYQAYFTVSLRRTGADGHFNGIIVVAVSGSYFASFYNSLLGGAEHYTASVLKDDGTVLAQFLQPGGKAADPLRPDPLLGRAIATGADSGIVDEGTAFDGTGRLVAIRRVASYPVFVAIEQSKSSIFRIWERSIVGYAIIGIGAAVAIVALALLALRRTDRERMAQMRANEALARRSALEVQLHRAQRLEAVGLLTSGIAHDFNNLLMVVAGNIERLQTMLEGDDDGRAERLLGAARSACDRAAALTLRLLGFARREPDNPQSIDVNDVVAETLDLPWQAGDGITVDQRLGKNLWPVSVDRNELTTALLNLAINARDAMPEGGRLTIETANYSRFETRSAPSSEPAGEYVGISIADTGQGMPQEVREKALDPFFTTKEPGKGTGLGLSLVNAFVTRAGGRCTIDSEPGRGTTVRLYLPRHRTGVDDAGIGPTLGGNGERIAAAEDRPR
jgi:two-component system, NtrC family, sensor kinase